MLATTLAGCAASSHANGPDAAPALRPGVEDSNQVYKGPPSAHESAFWVAVRDADDAGRATAVSQLLVNDLFQRTWPAALRQVAGMYIPFTFIPLACHAVYETRAALDRARAAPAAAVRRARRADHGGGDGDRLRDPTAGGRRGQL